MVLVFVPVLVPVLVLVPVVVVVVGAVVVVFMVMVVVPMLSFGMVVPPFGLVRSVTAWVRLFTAPRIMR